MLVLWQFLSEDLANLYSKQLRKYSFIVTRFLEHLVGFYYNGWKITTPLWWRRSYVGHFNVKRFSKSASFPLWSQLNNVLEFHFIPCNVLMFGVSLIELSRTAKRTDYYAWNHTLFHCQDIQICYRGFSPAAWAFVLKGKCLPTHCGRSTVRLINVCLELSESPLMTSAVKLDSFRAKVDSRHLW